MESAIRLEHVTKHYKGFTLDDISVDIPRGCIVGLVGENGAGKTTVIKAILGMLNLDQGTVYIDGENLQDLPGDWKKSVGTVLGNLGFFAQGTAAMLGSCMADIYDNWDKAVYAKYLEQFQIPVEKKIRDYSRGMTMKLVLALAFSHHAKLLLLDEPTSGLDPVVREEILEILLDFIQDENHTVLISSHIISDLDKTADYIAFLQNGKLKFMESKEKLEEDYGMVRCSKEDFNKIPSAYIQGVRKSAFDCEVLIKGKKQFSREFPKFILQRAEIEEIIVYSVRGQREKEEANNERIN